MNGKNNATIGAIMRKSDTLMPVKGIITNDNAYISLGKELNSFL